MSRIIAFPLASPAGRAATADVATLAARLQRIEQSESGDEAIMDLVVEAETTALAALAAAPARHYGDATVKLATLLRRVEADDEGFLPAGEMALLRSALRDLHRLGRSVVAAQA